LPMVALGLVFLARRSDLPMSQYYIATITLADRILSDFWVGCEAGKVLSTANCAEEGML
jgi:hypothetical protein